MQTCRRRWATFQASETEPGIALNAALLLPCLLFAFPLMFNRSTIGSFRHLASPCKKTDWVPSRRCWGTPVTFPNQNSLYCTRVRTYIRGERKGVTVCPRDDSDISRVFGSPLITPLELHISNVFRWEAVGIGAKLAILALDPFALRGGKR